MLGPMVVMKPTAGSLSSPARRRRGGRANRSDRGCEPGAAGRSAADDAEAAPRMHGGSDPRSFTSSPVRMRATGKV